MPQGSYYALHSSILAKSDGREMCEIIGPTYSRVAKAVAEIAQHLDSNYEVSPLVFSWVASNYIDSDTEFWCSTTMFPDTVEHACNLAFCETQKELLAGRSGGIPERLKSFLDYGSNVRVFDHKVVYEDGTVEEGDFKYFVGLGRVALIEGERRLPDGGSCSGDFNWHSGEGDNTHLVKGVFKHADGKVEEGKFTFIDRVGRLHLTKGSVRKGYLQTTGEWRYSGSQGKVVAHGIRTKSLFPEKTAQSIRNTTEGLLALQRQVDVADTLRTEVAEFTAVGQKASSPETPDEFKLALTNYLYLYRKISASLSRLAHPDKIGSRYQADLHRPALEKIQTLRNSVHSLIEEWRNSVPTP